jgi:hypothetical protein
MLVAPLTRSLTYVLHTYNLLHLYRYIDDRDRLQKKRQTGIASGLSPCHHVITAQDVQALNGGFHHEQV